MLGLVIDYLVTNGPYGEQEEEGEEGGEVNGTRYLEIYTIPCIFACTRDG